MPSSRPNANALHISQSLTPRTLERPLLQTNPIYDARSNDQVLLGLQPKLDCYPMSNMPHGVTEQIKLATAHCFSHSCDILQRSAGTGQKSERKQQKPISPSQLLLARYWDELKQPSPAIPLPYNCTVLCKTYANFCIYKQLSLDCCCFVLLQAAKVFAIAHFVKIVLH